MARSPLIVDTPLGKLYCIDLGGGACMFMIEQDGQAMTFPLDQQEARKLTNYMRATLPSAGTPGQRSRGRPPGSPNLSDEELKATVDLYVSEQAGNHKGSRAAYVGEQLGLTDTTVYGRLSRAKERGLYVGDSD